MGEGRFSGEGLVQRVLEQGQTDRFHDEAGGLPHALDLPAPRL